MTQPLTQVGPYTITREVGRGGMGVVYLAHDARLERDVAIKALPAEFAIDPARLERFEREARTLAGLSHPNVAGILGVEDGSGEQAGTRFLILEYVAGDTLADRLDHGAFPVVEALEIAVGVASGIEAAHDAGIVHRDLKPANVKLTEDGVPKVLDFGLARVDDSQTGSSVGGLDSPTMTSPVPQHSPTIEGAILGTAAYMSPEQARGRRIDKRTDVWSFGVLLYEMLVGAGPFHGETATDSIGAILHKEPDLGLLPDDVPVGVATMIRRCLVRDRTQRLQAIGDARVELQEALRRIESGEPEFPARDPVIAPRPRGIARFAWPALAGVLAIALVALAVVSSRPDDEASSDRAAVAGATRDAGPITPDVVGVRQVTDIDGSEWDPAIAPDGRTVVFTLPDGGDEDIFVQRVGGRNPLNLTEDSDADDFDPAFSPDGERIAFASTRGGGGIYVMGATGENPRRVAEFGFDPAWSPDGSRIVFTTQRVDLAWSRQATAALHVVDLESGEITDLDTGAGPEADLWSGDAVAPAWSPDGRFIAYWAVDGGQRDLFTIPVAGGDRVAVTQDAETDWNPVWTPDGDRLVFLSDRGGVAGAWTIAIDAATGGPIGTPEPLAISPAPLVEGALVADGSAMLVLGISTRFVIERVEADLTAGTLRGVPEQIRSSEQPITSPDLSTDGDRLVFGSSMSEEDIAVFDFSTGRIRRLTADADRDRGPMFLPGDDRVIFYSNRDGSYRLWEIRLDGGGLRAVSPETSGSGLTTPVPSPRGDLVAALQAGSGRVTMRLFDRDADGVLAPRDLSFENVAPQAWSPDGTRLLCVRRRGIGGALATFDPTDGTFTDVPGLAGDPLSGRGGDGRWIDDGRVISFDIDEERLVVSDLESGEATVIDGRLRGIVTPLVLGRVPGDEDVVSLVLVRIERESSLWLLDLEVAAPSASE